MRNSRFCYSILSYLILILPSRFVAKPNTDECGNGEKKFFQCFFFYCLFTSFFFFARKLRGLAAIKIPGLCNVSTNLCKYRTHFDSNKIVRVHKPIFSMRCDDSFSLALFKALHANHIIILYVNLCVCAKNFAFLFSHWHANNLDVCELIVVRLQIWNTLQLKATGEKL